MTIATCGRLAALALLASTPLLTDVLAQSSLGFRSEDLYRLQSVREVTLSPDGRRIAYSVVKTDRPDGSSVALYVLDHRAGTTVRLGGPNARGGGMRWSPDGEWIGFYGSDGQRSGVMAARPDGSPPVWLAPIEHTNHPLPSANTALTWAPDSKRIAYVSTTPGPEQTASGDPMVITRYLYKPSALEGLTRFNDNRRTHLFVVDLATQAVRQLTQGHFYEHSMDWSPRGDEILFVSNREADPDRVFNYDVFAVRVSAGTVRRLTSTPSAEYRPVWSPDASSIAFLGTKRDRTSSETTMEDTHVWLMDPDGSNRRELGAVLDNRQAAPRWSADGTAVFCSVQERGSIKLVRLPLSGAPAETVIGDAGTITGWSLDSGGGIAYAFSPPSGPADLFMKEGPTVTRLTSLNALLLATRRLASVESFTFASVDGTEVEAFLTTPLERGEGTLHPMVVMVHGGPHGQQGPTFNLKTQVYAARGWASLMVNYRGSTGYGQKFADAIFRDQNGREAEDVLAGVDAALARYPWIDRSRLGIEGVSYGGQLTNWIVTRTDRFKAAVPLAGIANLVSFNYMAYYHDYLAVEFGSYPHEDGLMDLLWARSPIRHVARVRTPTLLLHGENDNDVPIAEAEQFYIALKDVGVETVLVRYPREGHGLAEPGHIVDAMNRSMEWYARHFGGRDRPTPEGGR